MLFKGIICVVDVVDAIFTFFPSILHIKWGISIMEMWKTRLLTTVEGMSFFLAHRSGKDGFEARRRGEEGYGLGEGVLARKCS